MNKQEKLQTIVDEAEKLAAQPKPRLEGVLYGEPVMFWEGPWGYCLLFPETIWTAKKKRGCDNAGLDEELFHSKTEKVTALVAPPTATELVAAWRRI